MQTLPPLQGQLPPYDPLDRPRRDDDAFFLRDDESDVFRVEPYSLDEEK
jgi:hypothetical protein